MVRRRAAKGAGGCALSPRCRKLPHHERTATRVGRGRRVRGVLRPPGEAQRHHLRDVRGARAGACTERRADEAVRAVLLRGEGAGFCAGNDLQDFLSGPEFTLQHPVMEAAAHARHLRQAAARGGARPDGRHRRDDAAALRPGRRRRAARSSRCPSSALGLVPEAAQLAAAAAPHRPRSAPRSCLFLGKPFDAAAAAAARARDRVVRGERAARGRRAALARERCRAAALRRSRPHGGCCAGIRPRCSARIEEEARLFGAQLRSAEFRPACAPFSPAGARAKGRRSKARAHDDLLARWTHPGRRPVRLRAPAGLLIGDVIVGPRCYVGPRRLAARGLRSHRAAPPARNVQDGCVLHCFPGKDTLPRGGRARRPWGGAARLHSSRRGALIGIGAIVMDDAVVEEEAFVGAASFVRGRLRRAAPHARPGRTGARGARA